MRVLIVESPNKARTIQKYFKDFKVLATAGHFKDLPEDRLGVDKEFNMQFEYLKGKGKIIAFIKKEVKNAKEIYIATDPDREGEAIAYHIMKELKIDLNKQCRIRFYEVTKESIEKALKNVDKLDINLVKSQFARRILDRLIGYPLSSEVIKHFNERNLSVGRVQSAVLALLYEKEKQIENFKQKVYYVVVAQFDKFKATSRAFESSEEAQKLAEKVKDGLKVKTYEEKKVYIDPPKPFNTSEILKEAGEKLKYPVAKTQAIAQKLFEEGYITYPRTDTHRMDEAKANMFLDYIEKTYGENYRGKLRTFREKANVQGAHECIRIVEVNKQHSEPLYDLIYRRTLSSLMSPAVVLKQKATFEHDFIAEGEILLFDGWTKLEKLDLSSPLPKLKEGEILKPIKVFVEKRKTEPPPRYTQASLVKKMETLGIGRPSTYATAINTILKREYAIVQKNNLKLTDRGLKVYMYLKEKYPELVDIKFTAIMEDELDQVAENKTDYKQTIRKLLELSKTAHVLELL